MSIIVTLIIVVVVIALVLWLLPIALTYLNVTPPASNIVMGLVIILLLLFALVKMGILDSLP